MNTHRLIEMLSTNVEPVTRRDVGRALTLAAVVGAVAAFCVMLATVSLRTDLLSGGSLAFVTLKLLFAIAVIGAGVAYLVPSVQPGREARRRFRLVLVPFIAITVGAVADVAFGAAAVSHSLMAGQWVLCLYCIPLFAVVPFALLIWALRRGAPTDLARTGTIAGAVAGAVGAAAYAFHCPDDSIPFITLWYGASIALCAAVGAKLGPRVLRW